MQRALSVLLGVLLMISLISCGDKSVEGDSSPMSSEMSVSETSSQTTTSTSTTGRVSRVTTTTTTTTTAPAPSFVLPTEGDWEEPVTVNTAELYNKQTSSYDDEAQVLRQTIQNKADTLKAAEGGRTFYVSYRGDDKNSGLSPETPWKTAHRLQLARLLFKEGDVILFERGGVYRDVSIYMKAGVSYGAYGTGPKPQLYGSDKNYADASLWKKTSTANVWRVEVPEPNNPTANGNRKKDIGNVVFDYGKVCASDYKVLSRDELNSDFDFCFSPEENAVYLYLSAGNPGALYDDIEMCPNEFILKAPYGAKNITIENLCLRYTGAHAISFDCASGITVRGCEIGYIGGSMLLEYTRYGNGVEFYGPTDSCTVEDCWIYQCFDAGYTNQGYECFQTNITIRRNLMEYSPYNIEIWVDRDADKGGMKNSVIENNVLRFAGYGFGANNRYSSGTGVIGNISCYDFVTPCDNVVIKNNVFDCSYRYVICIVYPNDSQGRGPTITNNTWIQKPFSDDRTKAIVGWTKFDETVKYECNTLEEMKASVAVFDLSPTAVILEK